MKNRLQAQRGVVLLISLLTLVIMAIAGLALARSVGVSNLIAGNISFKQGALAATDLGLQAGMAKFSATSAGYLATTTQTYSDSVANCYSATAFTKGAIDPRGVPNVLLNSKTFDTSYSACSITNSATSETVRYVIDRQCDSTVAGMIADENHCDVYSGSATSGSVTTSSTATGAEITPLYRITVRVDGPRQTVSFAQTLIRP